MPPGKRKGDLEWLESFSCHRDFRRPCRDAGRSHAGLAVSLPQAESWPQVFSALSNLASAALADFAIVPTSPLLCTASKTDFRVCCGASFAKLSAICCTAPAVVIIDLLTDCKCQQINVNFQCGLAPPVMIWSHCGYWWAYNQRVRGCRCLIRVVSRSSGARK